jgi:undecaprenyl-phosphate galactose phosphotransferase
MRSKRAGALLCIGDIVALSVSLVVAGIAAEYIAVNILGYAYIPMSASTIGERLPAFSLEAVAAIFAFYNRGHYSRVIPWWSQVRYIMLTVLILMLVDGFAHFAIKHQFSRLWIVLSWVCAFGFLLIGRYVARLVAQKMGVWGIPTIVIGDGNNLVETLFALNSESYAGYRLQSILYTGDKQSFDAEILPKSYQQVPVEYASGDIESYIQSHPGHFYVLAADSFKSFKTDKLIETIQQEGSWYAMVPPPVEGAQFYGSVPQYFFGHDVMFLFARNTIHSPFGRFIKRSLDVVISISALVAVAPLFCVIVLMVKKDGGPAFFAHERVGKGNKPFKCLKFRSMAIDAEARLKALLDSDPELKKEWEERQKLNRDPRITAIGDFIRKTSLDELPQLINVIKGEMSLVGPRPVVQDEMKHYGNKAKEYLSVRPGVTGLWQVSGRSDTSYTYRVYLDAWYVNNWSLWSDIVIFVKTFMVLILRRGAY